MRSRLTTKEKIGVIIKTLRGFEIGYAYLEPVIHEMVDESGARDEGKET